MLKKLNLRTSRGELIVLLEDWMPNPYYYLGKLLEFPWEQHNIKIYGKTIKQPRLTAWFSSNEYSYSGITHKPSPLPSYLEDIRKDLEKTVGCKLPDVLSNLYRDGLDSVGWHSDDEECLGPRPTIASLSLGASRTFSLRDKGDKKIRLDITLTHGSLLIMSGTTQTFWQHCIPKDKAETESRINLTFRSRVN